MPNWSARRLTELLPESAPVSLTPSAVAIPVAVPSVSVAKTKALTPSAVTIPIATPSVSVAHALALTPSPVALPIATPSVSIALQNQLLPIPVYIPLVATSVSISLALGLSPSSVAVPIAAPSVAVSLTNSLTPSAVTIPIATPSVTMSLLKTLTPTPVEIPVVASSVVASETKSFWRLWFGPSGAEAKMQVDGLTTLLGARHPTKASYDMPVGFGSPHGSAYDSVSGKVFICTRGAPYRLIRLNPDDLDDYTYITAPAGDQWASALVIVGTRLFLNFTRSGSEHTFIDEYDTEDATPIRVAQYDLGEYGDSDALTTDGTALFVGTGQNKVVRCAIADLPAPVVTVTAALGSGAGGAHAMRYSSGKLYVGVAGHHIYRLNSTTLAAEDSIDLAGISFTVTDDAALAGDYVYFGWEANGAGRILKVPKVNLAGYSVLSVSRGTADNCYGVFEEPGEDYVWAVFTDNIVVTPKMPGELTRVKVSDDTFQRFWLTETQPNELVFCGSKDKIFLTTYLTPTSFIRLENLITDDPVQTSVPRSYWWPIRLYTESSSTIDDIKTYTDGVKSLGTNIDLKGNKATAYTEPTGTPGVGGTELTVGNYPTLAGAPVDVFTWLIGAKFTVDLGPETGPSDIGDFLVLQMSFGVSCPVGPTPTEDLTLTYDSDAIARSKVATLYGDYDLTLTPDSTATPLVVPGVTLSLSLTLTPPPVVIPAVVPSVTLALGIEPSPVSVPIVVPAVSLSLTNALTPSPVPIPAVVPSVTVGRTLLPTPIAVLASVPSVSLSLTLTITPSPAQVLTAVPSTSIARTLPVVPVAIPTVVPSVSVSLTLSVAPDPVQVPIVAPSVSILFSKILSPDALPIPAVVPSVTVGLTFALAPPPVQILIVAPSVAASQNQELLPDPAAASLVVPSVGVLQGIVIAPSPVLVPAVVPSASVGLSLTLTPSPATIPVVAPSVVAAAGTALIPDSVQIPIAVPSASVSLSFPLAPPPVEIPVVAPSVAVRQDIALTPTSVEAAVVVPSVSVFQGLVVSPSPVGIPTVVPSVSVAHVLSIGPSPAEIPVVVPAASLGMGNIDIVPSPAVVQGVVPDPTLVIAYGISPTSTQIPVLVPAPALVMGLLSLIPDPEEIVLVIPSVIVTGGTPPPEELPLLEDVLEPCYALWEMDDTQEWPSRVRPSGFRAPPDTPPAPSGYRGRD